MKRLFIILAAAMMAVLFTSCENQNRDAKTIIGHSYKAVYDSKNWETFYFSPSGSATLSAVLRGESKSWVHLTYTIRGDNVEVRHDFNDYWLDEYKGELLSAFTYLPETDCLLSTTGARYYRVK